MTYLTIGLALALGVTGVVAAIASAGWKAAKKEIEELQKKLSDADLAQKKAQAIFDQDIARKDRVIAELKAEIEIMEKDLGENKDPVAIRARLSKLLSSP